MREEVALSQIRFLYQHSRKLQVYLSQGLQWKRLQMHRSLNLYYIKCTTALWLEREVGAVQGETRSATSITCTIAEVALRFHTFFDSDDYLSFIAPRIK